jgi:hypothetical protein
MMRGDDELDVLQIGFFWKIGFLNKTLEESVEADVLVLKTMHGDQLKGKEEMFVIIYLCTFLSTR